MKFYEQIEDSVNNSLISGIHFTYFQQQREKNNDVENVDRIIFFNQLIVEYIKKTKNLNPFIQTLFTQKKPEIIRDVDEKLLEIINKIGISNLKISIPSNIIYGTFLLEEYLKQNSAINIEKKEELLEILIFIYSFIFDYKNFINRVVPPKFSNIKQFLEIIDKEKKEKDLNFLEKDTNIFSSKILQSFVKYIQIKFQDLKKISENEILNKTIEAIDINQLDEKKIFIRNNVCYDITHNLIKMNNNNILIYGKRGIGKRTTIQSLPLFFEKENIPFFNKQQFLYINIIDLLEPTIKNIFDFQRQIDEHIHSFNIIFEYLNSIDNNTMVIWDLGNISLKHNQFLDIFMPKLIDLIISNEYIQSILISDNEENIPGFFNSSEDFCTIELKEPSIEDLENIAILTKSKYEKYFDIKLSYENINFLVKNFTKNIQSLNINQFNSFVDESLSKIILKSNKRSFSNNEIENFIKEEQKDGIKSTNINELDSFLKKHVFGQNHVVENITNHFEIVQAGLREKNKPIGSFMFSGNSGTGKTEIARKLSEFLNIKLLRYDMTEFQEGHSISKFLGSPAGYVGYEEGSPLIKELEKHPNCILLLDEIEKAHPSVIKLFLQVLEEATIKGSNGKSINLSNILIIFTTNAGSKSHIEKEVGFGINNQNFQIKNFEKIKKDFPIEFINRIDEVIYFNELSKKDIENIIFKEIDKLISLLDVKIPFKISNKSIEHLLKEGYDIELGARKIKRVIEKKLKLILAKKLNNIKGKKENIKELLIDFKDENFNIEVKFK